jgi:hypothetical protein
MTDHRSPTRRARAAANSPAEPIQPFPCTDRRAQPIGLRLRAHAARRSAA